MAIKDHFRRALHKSDSSSSLSQSDSNTTTTTNSTYTTTITSSNGSQTSLSATQSLHQDNRHSLHLSRAFTWGHRDKDKQKEKDRKKEEKKKAKSKPQRRIHPSEKPLTAQNLRHQQMLSQFTMTFGATRAEQFGAPSIGGVSPCCTRPPSIINVEP